MGMHGDYLIHDEARRAVRQGAGAVAGAAAAFTVWAVLRALGRDGVADLVDGLCDTRRGARRRASRRSTGAEVLNDVVFTQVCAAFGNDERTRDGGPAAAGRRHGVDVRLALARPGRAAGVGQQLVDERDGRGAQPRRPAGGRRRIGSGPCVSRDSPPARTRCTAWSPARSTSSASPTDDSVVVALAGDPLYVGVKLLDQEYRLEDVRLLAPVLPRSKVVGIGRNYAAHAAEMGNDLPDRAADVPQAEHQRRRPGRPDLLPARRRRTCTSRASSRS